MYLVVRADLDIFCQLERLGKQGALDVWRQWEQLEIVWQVSHEGLHLWEQCCLKVFFLLRIDIFFLHSLDQGRVCIDNGTDITVAIQTSQLTQDARAGCILHWDDKSHLRSERRI